MNLEYTKRETITIRGKNNEPLMDVDAEISGIITWDNADDERNWRHNGMTAVSMKMWDGSYKRIPEDAAAVIYDAFCKAWTAQDLAEAHQ